MLNGKELQVGKSYVVRDGTFVKIVSVLDKEVYRYIGDNDESYSEFGTIWWDKDPHSKDIVSERTEVAPQEFNEVTKPRHYQLFPELNIEVKHVVALLCNRLGTNGYNGAFIADFAQMLQYLMRFDEKNGREDLEKAKEFLGGMLEKYPDVQQLKGQK